MVKITINMHEQVKVWRLQGFYLNQVLLIRITEIMYKVDYLRH